MEDITTELLAQLRTVDEAKNFGRRLRELLESIHDTDETTHETMQNIFTEEEIRLLSPLLQSGDTYSRIEDLLTVLASLPVVELELAFSPSSRFLEKLSARVKSLAGKAAVLELTVRNEIVGGAVINFQGVHRDYSLAKRLRSR